MVNDCCHGKQENQDKPHKAKEAGLFVYKNFKLYGKNRLILEVKLLLMLAFINKL